MAKKSFSSRKDSKKNSKENEYASEFGAVIKNDPQNYPSTGEWKTQFPLIDATKCVGCGICVDSCPEGAIQLKKVDGKMRAVIDMRWCKGEGMCATTCPRQAIKLIKKS